VSRIRCVRRKSVSRGGRGWSVIGADDVEGSDIRLNGGLKTNAMAWYTAIFPVD